MEDCSSLSDPKVATRPVLYVPAQFPVPEQLSQVAERCHIDVRPLPQVIRQLGDVDPTRLAGAGPALPAAPLRRARRLFQRDVRLGQLLHRAGAPGRSPRRPGARYGRERIVRGRAIRWRAECEPHVLPQPIAAAAAQRDDPRAARGPGKLSTPRPQSTTGWCRPIRSRYATTRSGCARSITPAHTGLARYQDLGSGAVLEMRDSRFYRHVIEWLLAHPAEGPGYLMKAAEHPDAAEAARLSARELRRPLLGGVREGLGRRLSIDRRLLSRRSGDA